MSIEQSLNNRSDSKCELCAAENELAALAVAPYRDELPEHHILCCDTCRTQIAGESDLNPNHWRCLNDSMWNPEAAVQVSAWRMLKRLSAEPWAQDLLDMLYLEGEVRAWAESGQDEDEDASVITRDSNGAVLQAGDTVTLIKDLDVKGANFTAKRGTAVRNIGLTDNPEHIEGKVNGVRIVLLACFLKKAN